MATKTVPAAATIPTYSSPAAPTGYASNVDFFASRYKQGGRTVYSLDLSPEQITATVTEPDVSIASPGNRAIRPAHADSFAKYFRERADWVSPSLMLRGPKTFDFETQNEVGGIQFGSLSIPRRALGDLHIVDGQHRILGMFRAEKGIASDLDAARSNLAMARKNDGAGSVGEKEARARITKLEAQRSRMNTERINVQIFIESDPTLYRQMFFDIADNALGITASVKTRFDSRKVVHRTLAGMSEHPLLKGRVDPEGDRMGRGSPFIMGAKHVAEIIRTVNVGLDGRVSRRQEEALQESDLRDRTNRFFDIAMKSFPQLSALALGQINADDLRKTSMLGSVLFFRVLGGVFYELVVEHHWSDDQVEAFFSRLAPHLVAPVYDASIWIADAPSGLFGDGARGPRGRRQDLKQLKNTITEWAIDSPAFIDEAPAPRPVPPTEAELWAEEDPEYVDLGMDLPVK